MFVFAVLFIVNLYILYQTGVKPSVLTDEKWTIYGSMGCGWTRKQLEYMKKNGKPYVFIDCDKEECEGKKGFPTTIGPDGTETLGFKEF